MIYQCFVTNCENTTGVLFPEDEVAKQKWLEALQIENVPSIYDFVCLAHFAESDLLEGTEDLTPSARVKEGAIPIIISKDENTHSEQENIDNETEISSQIIETNTEENVILEEEQKELEVQEHIEESPPEDSNPPQTLITEVDGNSQNLPLEDTANSSSNTTVEEHDPNPQNVAIEDNTNSSQNMTIEENEANSSQNVTMENEANRNMTMEEDEANPKLTVDENDESFSQNITMKEDEANSSQNITMEEDEANFSQNITMEAEVLNSSQDLCTEDVNSSQNLSTEDVNSSQNLSTEDVNSSQNLSTEEDANSPQNMTMDEDEVNSAQDITLEENEATLSQTMEDEETSTQMLERELMGDNLEGGEVVIEQATEHNESVVEETVEAISEHIVEENVLLNVDPAPPTKVTDVDVCRLCMAHENLITTISDKLEEGNAPAKNVIANCLYPLVVTEDDGLPQHVCSTCWDMLRMCYKFRQTCFETDKRLQKNKARITSKRKDPSQDSKFASKSKKPRMESSLNAATVLERRIFSSSSESVASTSSDFVSAEVNHPTQNPQNPNNESASIDSGISLPGVSSSPPPLVPIKRTLSDIVAETCSKSSISVSVPRSVSEIIVSSAAARQKRERAKNVELDMKFKKVEEQLRKVLEGTLDQDMMQAENIIIEVESDEEGSWHEPKTSISSSASDQSQSVKRLKLPLKIKDKQSEDKYNLRAAVDNIILPKGIRVSKYQSPVGTFHCGVVRGLFDTEFCQADGYLFEYRLSKGKIRYLKCVVTTCPAVAQQRLLRPGVYESKITVRMSHNHEVPNNGEMKKQMFYYVMKRKMQSDKTLNFRNVYDDVCRLDPEIKNLVPLRNVINEICRHQLTYKLPPIRTFDEFYDLVEEDVFQKLHFTHNGKQFYQEKFTVEDGSKAIVFANQEIIQNMSASKIMYVDASFKIDTPESFSYQLVTILLWVEDSYFPVMYALVSRKTQDIFRKIFQYLHDTLAPDLRPHEIVTDYEANLYYALGETFLGSHIGGSCFYYTQNLYKKICALNLSRDLETNSFFRNIYHMLLMLPLLPVNTIVDGLHNIEVQAKELGLGDLTKPLFQHVRNQWIAKVTPELFCVHRLENRINENVIAPFKKLRDFLMLTKGKVQRQPSTVITVVEKIIELEAFLRFTYANENKKSFARDLSSSQKKNVIRAWLYIENHPKININNFFSKVLGYIKCMENQLWIWGFYRYVGDTADDLINAENFSIVNTSDSEMVTEGETVEEVEDDAQYVYTEESEGDTVVMEGVIDDEGEFVFTENAEEGEVQEVEQIDVIEQTVNTTPARNLKIGGLEGEAQGSTGQYESAYLKYVYRE